MPHKKQNATRRPTERAEHLGQMVAIAIQARNWDRGHEIIDHAKEELSAPPVDPMTMAVAELQLEQRYIAGLDKMGVLMVDQLLELTPRDILDQEGFGPIALAAIRESLRQAWIGLVGTGLHIR